MRPTNVRNLRAETEALSSCKNGYSFGLLSEPGGLPLPYLLPLRKKPRGFGWGSMGLTG